MTSGLSLQLSPIRIFYLLIPGAISNVETGFSVTRNIRGAVARNYVKRRLRESFRKNSHILCSNPRVPGSLKLVLLYAQRSANIRKEIKHEAIDTSVAAILLMLRNQLAGKK